MTRTMPLTHGTQGDAQTVCGMDLENSYYGRLIEVIKQNTAVLMTRFMIRALPVLLAACARHAPPCALMSDSDDYALLTRRVRALATTKLPMLVLPEVLLPRQKMRLVLTSDEAAMIRRHAGAQVCVGTLTEGTSQTHGVEAVVVEVSQEFNDSGYGDPCVYTATLLGRRIFELDGGAGDGASPSSSSMPIRYVDLGLSDQLQAARTPLSRASELVARELNLLVDTWLELVRGGGETLWGRKRGRERDWSHIAAVNRMMADLGELPGISRPSERALWVAALINPCNVEEEAWPGLDVRARVLTAETPTERLMLAKTGIVDSIYRLKGGKWPLNSYYW